MRVASTMTSLGSAAIWRHDRMCFVVDAWHFLLKLRKGDTFVTRGAMRTVEFKVVDIATATEEEADYCYVNEDTEILYEGEALKVT